MDWERFRESRDRARAEGTSPLSFEQVSRQNGILSPRVGFCRTCWEAKDLKSMSKSSSHICCSCYSAKNAEWNQRAQEQTLAHGTPKNYGTEWTQDEDDYLQSHIGTRTMVIMALHLGRTRAATSARCTHLGLLGKKQQGVSEVLSIDGWWRVSRMPLHLPIRAEHQIDKHRIVVFCHVATTNEEIEKAFTDSGIAHEEFVLWCVRAKEWPT